MDGTWLLHKKCSYGISRLSVLWVPIAGTMQWDIIIIYIHTYIYIYIYIYFNIHNIVLGHAIKGSELLFVMILVVIVGD